jgi:hypothetical protein
MFPELTKVQVTPNSGNLLPKVPLILDISVQALQNHT